MTGREGNTASAVLRVDKVDGRWEAREAGVLTGRAHCWVRPDGKRFAAFASEDTAVVAALGAAITAEDGRTLHTTADAEDRATLLRLAEAGFTGERHGHRWRLPVAVAAEWDREALGPFVILSPEDVDPAALRRFDDTLRADVPGLWGWRWSPEAWAAEHASPAYDPALYPVLWDPGEGRYAGLARVWSNPDGPRLGLVALARPYRRRGLGAALLAQAFRVLRDRGYASVTTECDAANPCSAALLAKAGGVVTGGEIELVRRA